jgi:hypothetical protein
MRTHTAKIATNMLDPASGRKISAWARRAAPSRRPKASKKSRLQ